MFRWILAAAIMPLFAVAHADVRMDTETTAVSAPYTPWELRFPGKGWVLFAKQVKQNGLQYYYSFGNLKKGLNVSFFIEPAYKCDTSEACRTLFWKDPGPMAKDAGAVRFFDANRFSVVEFVANVPDDIVPGMKAKTPLHHWSAHFVNDGIWMDMHISSPATKDFKDFKAFVGTVVVSQKPVCPLCIKSSGLSRQQSTVLFGKTRNGDTEAWKHLQATAEKGDSEAQFMVARVYSWGSPLVKQDETQSAAWLRKAAANGHADAQVNLGYFYVSGRGADKKDVPAAIEQFTKAAEQGNALAQYNLAMVYATDPVYKDEDKAFEWRRKAAEQGLVAAQTGMGTAYSRGTGVSKDIQKSLEWYQKAAAQADEEALLNVAIIYGVLSKDSKAVNSSIAILNTPILAVDPRTAKVREMVCKANPEICRSEANEKTPAPDSAGKPKP
jgi:TPR repeat protein